jgi:hypothetical protein
MYADSPEEMKVIRLAPADTYTNQRTWKQEIWDKNYRRSLTTYNKKQHIKRRIFSKPVEKQMSGDVT